MYRFKFSNKHFITVLKHIFYGCILCFSINSYAHPSPNTQAYLDISPGRVGLELQIPLTELELAFGHSLTQSPETVPQRLNKELKDYLLTHIHAFSNKNQSWDVKLIDLGMTKGIYETSNVPYWELSAHLLLLPLNNESTRQFTLVYDVVMHQVINHAAIFSVRNDWENGLIHQEATDAVALSWDLAENRISPFEVNLDKGSRWKGLKSMFVLGTQHIKEGTDHLLFLLVLLLPAMLLVSGNRWNGFGGLKFSVIHIVKIVTAFTIGHSLTLLLAALGWVRLPSQPVEILIALSILISAIHAIWPLFYGKEFLIAAGFGLIHGLAFAGVLTDMRLEGSTLLFSVVAFNLGIEMMQLLIVVVVMPWLIILSRQKTYTWFRNAVAIMAGIAAIGWMVQRFINKPNLISIFTEKITTNNIWLLIGLATLSIINLIWVNSRKNSRLIS